MPHTIAIISPGAMGSAVGARLHAGGATVLTSLAGRNAGSASRAGAAGMEPADDARIAGSDIVLSIVPPRDAAALAERLVPALEKSAHKPIYVDCNAVDVRTVRRVEALIVPTGARFADAGIIGGPPKPGEVGPTFYLSGEAAPELSVLAQLGIKTRMLDGPVGAASALKMSYAGITKGLTAIGAAMILAATRAGVAEALHEELAASQPQLLAGFARAMPDMYGKAYRWVAEMREIAAFIGRDQPEHAIYEGMAGLYEHIAADEGGETGAIDRFLASG